MKKTRLVVNECEIMKRDYEAKEDGFSTEIIQFDSENRIGIECIWDYWLRIDEIHTNNKKSLWKLLDAAKLIAKSRGYEMIRFADAIKLEVLLWMKEYGFDEEIVSGDSFNHYLYYQIEEGEENDS